MRPFPNWVLVLPFALQGLCMFFDEFYFHSKRSLPRWERIGHPLDTLTVLAVYGFCLGVPHSSGGLPYMIGLCAFSCLFITKDEWVHHESCPPAEVWLHSVLFILHPVVFLATWILWSEGKQELLGWQTLVTGVFFIYQTLRWNTSWKKT